VTRRMSVYETSTDLWRLPNSPDGVELGLRDRRQPRQERSVPTYAETLQYLRIGRRAFEIHVRPLLPLPVKVGTRVLWNREDIDRAWQEYASRRNGRPGTKGGNSWADPESPASIPTDMADGGSTSGTRASDFASALRRLKRRKRGCSHGSTSYGS
jgi:hypothetical protein